MEQMLRASGYEPSSVGEGSSSKTIWQRPGYQSIAYSDGDEAEERIAKIIREASDLSVLSPELRRQCSDWPSTYHLAGTRVNSLRPFEHLLKGDILEIGPGCGAITRFLGERDGVQVLALEGSVRRAKICRERTRDLSHVTVVSERFADFKTSMKFDVVTLIGVLEYASLFTPNADDIDPTSSVLKMIRHLLKPNGVLIIAIENQLGLKYLAGAPEDHVLEPMHGVENRYTAKGAHTFGRRKLESLIHQSGFEHLQTLGCFPDYKFPSSILTAKSDAQPHFDGSAFAWQSAAKDRLSPKVWSFSPSLVWPSVFENGLGRDLANSFLIVASSSKENVSTKDDLAYHYSSERLPEYCKVAKFVALSPEHVEIRYAPLTSKAFDPHVKQNDLIHYQQPETTSYSWGEPLSYRFLKAVTKHGWTFQELGVHLRDYVSYVRKEAGLSPSQPNPDLAGHMIDVIPNNIIVLPDGAFQTIDKEWVLQKSVSLSQLVFRTLMYTVVMVQRFGVLASKEPCTRKEFFKRAMAEVDLLVSDQDLAGLFQFEIDLQKTVTGQDFPENYQSAFIDAELATGLAWQFVDQSQEIRALEQELRTILTSRKWRLIDGISKWLPKGLKS